MKLGIGLEISVYPTEQRMSQKGEGLLQLEQQLKKGLRPVSGNDGTPELVSTGNYKPLNSTGAYVARKHEGSA